ncbi:DNA binding protein SART-1 [Arthroderma uncinatum]|uniref:DNA binding protein SART-1 n=1 Tax=Arthroderma uncinatum TaxID=74035 RepID=UPI00144A8431|nr:DNA binding protein SART-1 [Arthroderma uncinatum]KAF3481291.1 DNA binding protein SART-1 [Arthroderma uncinatum]
MADALSIEQNNKIRVALGLAPLPVPGAANDGPAFKSGDGDESASSDGEEPGSTLESRAAQGYDNWKAVQDEQEAQKKREARKDAIRRARETARRMAKLEGKGLGEGGDDAEMDTRAWLMQHKKKQKKIEKERARKLAEELAEREQQMAEYTSKDLAGVRVAHEIGDFDDFDETGEKVLTLKDTTIDEDEEQGDELENIHMREGEKTKERLKLKKKKVAYDPNDMDASGTILSQYDEEIDGKKRKHFTLASNDLTPQAREARRQDVSSKLKMEPMNLDALLDKEVAASDYMDASEIKVKKPKKKKAKSTRRRAADDDEDVSPPIDTNGDQMETDEPPQAAPAVPAKRPREDISFVDDDDLQASLAAQRRAAFKKRKKLRPEDLARQLREESEQAQNEMDVDGAEEDQGLIINETSEFVANLQRPTLIERPRSVSREPAVETPTNPPQPTVEETSDVEMEPSYTIVEQEQVPEEQPKDMTTTGLEEETTLDQGLGATLAMLKQRGLVTAAEGDGQTINALHRDRQRFLAEKRRREAEAERLARSQRERDRASGKLDRMSARDREEYARWENKQRDQHESRAMADVFNREYKPDVQLKYVDEFGRKMNQKEAFKHLSHQFHGKGSGKMKTEKHLKKIEDERKREAMSTLDSSQNTGMNNAMGATAKKNRQAGVRLA